MYDPPREKGNEVLPGDGRTLRGCRTQEEKELNKGIKSPNGGFSKDFFCFALEKL